MLKRWTIILVVAASACSNDTSSSSTEAPVSVWQPLAPDAIYEGKSLEEWAIEWRRWSFTQTDCDRDTSFDPDGSLCADNQPEGSPVFFFGRAPRGTVRTQCKVPKDKAIAVPIAMFSNDNAGVDDPIAEDELRNSVMELRESARDLVLEVDGKIIDDLQNRAIGPVLMSYHIGPAPNWYTCRMKPQVADVTVQPAYLAGYLAILPPAAVGHHSLRYGATLSYRSVSSTLDTVSEFEVR